MKHVSPINPTPMSGLCGDGNSCGEGALTWVTLTHAGNGTLGYMECGNRCGGDTCRGLLRHTLLTRLGSTLAKVEVTVLKDAWHWGSNNSVVNNPLAEPGRTAFFCRPSVRMGLRGR